MPATPRAIYPTKLWNNISQIDAFTMVSTTKRTINSITDRITISMMALSAMPDTLMRDSNTYKNAVRFGLVIPNKKPVVFYFEENN